MYSQSCAIDYFLKILQALGFKDVILSSVLFEKATITMMMGIMMGMEDGTCLFYSRQNLITACDLDLNLDMYLDLKNLRKWKNLVA